MLLMSDLETAVNAHLLETRDEMKANVAKDLNISEDQIKFITRDNNTHIVVTDVYKDISTGVSFLIKIDESTIS